jgi:hypothetical protein
MARFEITSELSPAECVERLSAIVRPEWFLMPASNWEPRFESCPLVGRVGPKSIRVRKKIWWRNSVQPFVSARIEPDGRGCRIVGSIGPHPLAWAFVAVASAMLIGSVFYQLATGPIEQANMLWAGFFVMAVWVVFGLGRLAAWEEGGFLEKVILEAVQGCKVEPSSQD